jgi:hypothetical protein
VVLGEESFVALAEGLQSAFRAPGGRDARARERQPLGGIPQPGAGRGAGPAQRYEALCALYGTTSAPALTASTTASAAG